MNVDKENRPPRGVALAGDGKPAHHASNRESITLTPGGRKSRKTKVNDAQQYFEVGKLGRKTGISLPDTGIRDAHGLEPMEGIFSSPLRPSPERQNRNIGSTTLTSSDMHVHSSSSGLTVDQTLQLRKTPKLPPPRQSTPRHTNIGSPKRMSLSAQRPISRGGMEERESMGAKTGPPANRRLDFDGGNVRKSIENLSPFKPRRALRRSMGGHDVGSQDVFAEVEMPTSTETIAEEGDGGSAGFGDADVEDDAAIVTDDLDQDEGASVMPTLPLTAPSQRPRRFEDVETKARPQSQSSRPSSSGSNSSRQHKATSSKKRDRQSLESEHIAVSVVDSTVVHDQEPQSSPSRARKRSKTRPSDALSILAEEEELQEEDQSARTIDPSNLKFNATLLSDDALPDNAEDDDDDPRDAFPSPTPIPEPAPKTKRAAKAKAPSRKGRAHSTPAKPTASRGSASPSKQRPEGRGVSAGPSSTYALRATTPFEDATTRSRSGRNVIKPLQYWANESRIYRHGEIEGIVRANEVNIPKRRSNGAGTKKGKKVLGKRLDELERRLESIEEEEGGSGDAAYISEDRDVIERDEWEETLGVLAGSVARWDSATQTAVPITSDEDLVQEDLAFAAPSIATRPVASGLFNYAKILTMPFFGAGLVEVPPGGFKRAKNSRKMQMVFFVHEGKVTVEVGVGGGREGTVFAIAKGGCWSVPRGNNYAISNESQTTTAKIFFAQGCEVDLSAAAAVADGQAETAQ